MFVLLLKIRVLLTLLLTLPPLTGMLSHKPQTMWLEVSANFLDLNNLVFFQTTSTVLNVSGLQPGTSYFWQIQSICTGNPQPNSLFTAVDTFTTVLNAPKTSTEGFVIRIYPNPANNYVKVEKGANDVFEVYDAMGRKIISTTDFVVDVTILQKGVYYWRVIGDSSQSGGALEIMR